MVADTMVVDTRRVYGPHESSAPINLTIEGEESIFLIKPGRRDIPGTSTKLFLRKSKNPWDRMDENEFIKSVENVIPNPPFKIKIETESHQKTKDENSFKEIKADILRNHSWDKHVNIREFNLEFSDENNGFIGSAVIAILESHGTPTAAIEMTSRSIEIEGDSYSLDKNIRLSGNKISESTTSITIDENGDIDSSDSRNVLYESTSRLSSHGIEVPSTLFPKSWNMQKNQAKLSWPLPLLLVIDICGNNDLDLNSSRTQIIMSDKWIKLEATLSFVICSKIANSVTPKYWAELKNVLINNTKNETFIKSVNEVTINGAV